MAKTVLSVASECVPLVKTGGLADVVGALPGALAGQGIDMRVLMPAYPGLIERLDGAETVWQDSPLFGGDARVVKGDVGATRFLLLDAPHLYTRQGGIYGGSHGDYPDNPERFAALCFAASLIVRGALTDDWRPDILHAHDWQAGLAPAYMRYMGSEGCKSIITVHNIAFQGLSPSDRLHMLRLPPEEFHSDALEYYGQISTLKAGLVTADMITTVSPTYANELMRPEYGMGMQGVIAARADRVAGILNGVDTAIWSPDSDPEILSYTGDTLEKKADNRARLIADFGLGEVPGPLAIIVSRLTSQKGIDLIPEVLPEFLGDGGGLVVLGSGEAGLEEALRAAARSYPHRVGLHVGYDEALSHRLFAGGDAVLVPSRFEPCGLTQMYGLRYGTLPVVAATGGLADTVIHANPAALRTGVATGLTFHPTDALAFRQALRWLTRLHADPETWQRMQRTAMQQPVGWDASAVAYAELYRDLAG